MPGARGRDSKCERVRASREWAGWQGLKMREITYFDSSSTNDNVPLSLGDTNIETF